ncbi:ABC transporter substrate-binding protein [Lacicoccus alkaliphilus]|uniref:Iron complex transport system substrate-binding protein n=1 Tax=Lacicoccus alkaliphilus DSM 16010 TaxID=1123231 RepID=A0A1M7HYF4_9BACL|nr:ABC transporter substrate-binding protein [Salinicoccus alkaliphilus]SHM33409.1 iron complex transport system substrate-binding protein [Salinicoccus alkaliphilus DSM 16010]
MRKVIKTMVMLFLAMNLSGCGMMMMQQQQQQQNDFSEQQEHTSSDSDLSSDAGSELNSSESFSVGERRIVSLMPSNTEILAELGLGEEIEGISTADTYPEALIGDPDVSKLDAFEFDVEQLMALEPTHILSHESSRAVHGSVLEEAAAATGAEVIFIEEADTVDEIPQTFIDIGGFTGEDDMALEAARAFEEGLEEVAGQAVHGEGQTVFLQVSSGPEIYTTGRNTFLHDVLEKAGAENIFEDLDGFVSVSYEEILARDPDYIVSVSGADEGQLSEEVEAMRGIAGLSIKNTDRQCAIDPDLLTRPGPRLIEGMTELSECFKN